MLWGGAFVTHWPNVVIKTDMRQRLCGAGCESLGNLANVYNFPV